MLRKLNRILSFSHTRLVIVRHGETQSNEHKQWSGWSDSKLSKKGEEESSKCGRLLKQQKIQFDMAFTSMLSRSIRTLNFILEQMDQNYIPVYKRWELNQKFYGALQGQDKMRIVQEYGEKMVQQWRRSYIIAPPKIFPEDPRHPVNDKRYQYINPTLLPSTESLGDVHARVAEFYQRQIMPLLQSKKSIIVVCHGSNVRAFTRILLKFDQEKSRKFNVPNATPLLIDFQTDMRIKQWRLLGDIAQIEKKMNKLENELKKE